MLLAQLNLQALKVNAVAMLFKRVEPESIIILQETDKELHHFITHWDKSSQQCSAVPWDNNRGRLPSGGHLCPCTASTWECLYTVQRLKSSYSTYTSHTFLGLHDDTVLGHELKKLFFCDISGQSRDIDIGVTLFLNLKPTGGCKLQTWISSILYQNNCKERQGFLVQSTNTCNLEDDCFIS